MARKSAKHDVEIHFSNEDSFEEIDEWCSKQPVPYGRALLQVIRNGNRIPVITPDAQAVISDSIANN